MKLIIYQDPTNVYADKSISSSVVRTAMAGEHLSITSEGEQWIGVTDGWISYVKENHFILEDDIYELVASDAKIYLKDLEEVEFVDGVLQTTGAFTLNKDYKMGDIVGLHVGSIIIPVTIVEIAYIVDGNDTKVIPTFQKFTERD